MNTIFNENCLKTMQRDELGGKVDLVIVSPPNNIKTTDQEYLDWITSLFKGFEGVLTKDGCILCNLSYSSKNPSLMWLVVSEVIRNTIFTTADCITWKKPKATPNPSKNKLTRITEYVFVFCRKTEISTFNTNKKVRSISEKTDRPIYENTYNYIEADNYTELTGILIDMYGKKNGLVYDPFMGVSTTALSAVKWGMNYIGSEISKEQIEYGNILLHQVNIVDEPIKNIIEITIDDDFWNS